MKRKPCACVAKWEKKCRESRPGIVLPLPRPVAKLKQALDARDRLILKMLRTFEGLGNDGMARIDSRLWYEYFRRRVRRLGIKVK